MRDLTTPNKLAARERLLASVWSELASSSDWELALARLARLAVPECADWCFLQKRGSNDRSLWPYLQAERGSNGLIARLAGLRVLLIEDDEDWIELVVDLLTLAGAHVMVERSAQPALAQLEAEHPHVLLINIGLPQLNGWELIAQLRKSGAKYSRSVRVAAVSDDARPEDRDHAHAAGFQLFLPKSITAEDLLDAVIGLATTGVDTRSAS